MHGRNHERIAAGEVLGILRVKGINVFDWLDGGKDRIGIMLALEGELDQDPVHDRIVIPFLDDGHEFEIRRIRADAFENGFGADAFGGLHLLLDIDRGGCILTHLQNGQGWAELGGLKAFFGLLFEAARERLTINNRHGGRIELVPSKVEGLTEGYKTRYPQAHCMTQGPHHVAMIMDGNRRWAKERGLSTIDGHKAGYETMKNVGDWCIDRGVKVLTVYAFSTENWKRSETEVNFLMLLLETALEKEIEYFLTRQIRLRILGRREGFSKKILDLIDNAEKQTEHFQDFTFCICLNYGGRQEITDAVKAIVKAGIKEEEITEETVASHLYWPSMSNPDLIIRTSGEERLSGFLLWQAAYSELMWLKKFWPDLEERDIDSAFADFTERSRRFGK